MGSGSAFVGRAAELALLAEQAAAAGRGEGRAVLIGGEPGIGKTRLAGEAAACAAAAGMRWIRSRAVQDEGCPPYWMFGQVVRELAATHEPNESQRADLAVLSPGARPDASPPDAPPDALPDALSDALAGRRFAVFESVREYLTDAAAETGLVLVFDDVHWADAPSLRLLRHLAAGLGAARLLLLITYRDTETGGRDELTALLAALAREEAVSRIRLTGLSQDEVAAQLAAVTGGAVAPEVAAAIGRRTHGNPFFVAELGRLHSPSSDGASSDGASSDWASPGSLPEAVRDTVRVRLHDLTPACREVLCAAAVLGADLDPAAVAAVTGREVGAVLAALDEAAAAGIVVAGPGWGFGHDLVRETARLELPTAGRLAVHARMGAYLRGRPDAAPAMVAHHLLEALPMGDAGEAAAWAERAAAAAMAQLAWEDAAVFYARALRAVAERLGDPRALRSALRARQLARGGPEGAPDRVELGARMLALGVADGDDEAVLWGRLWRVDAFAQLGRVGDCSAEIALLEPVVARLRSPGPTWHLRRSELALAYGRGEFGRARRLALESLRLAAHGHENMRTLTSAVIVRLNVMTGLDEWPADEDFSWSPPLGLAMRALWESAMGRPGEARRHYQPGGALATVPRIRYLITYAIFAELAAAFEDASTADVVYQAMRPYADLFVCGGAGLTMVEGSVQRYLGLAASVLGRLDEAVRWLRGAVQVNAREGMAACEALAMLDLARVLDRRGDRAEASALALSAAAAGERLGMLPLVRDARSLSAALDGAAVSGGPLTRREFEVAGLVARGLTNGQIAAALHISERTAENHVQHILIKLGLHNRTQIAGWTAGRQRL